MARRYKRRYEVLLVIEAEDDSAGRAAADAAWYGADDTPGARVADSTARERKADQSIAEVRWDGWDEESTVDLSVAYDGSWDDRR